MTFSLSRLFQALLVLIGMSGMISCAQAGVQRLAYPAFEEFATECIVTPIFHVNSVSGYIKALALSNAFRHDKNMSFLPLCTALPTHISSYSCTMPQASANKSAALTEDVKRPKLQQRSQCYNLQLDAKSQHIIVTEMTKAFVNGAQMFLSESVTYNTFIHELAHFAFFAEEYPMRAELKAGQCRFPQDHWSAPNLWAVPKDAKLANYYSKHPFTDLYKMWLLEAPNRSKYLHGPCSSATEDWYTLMPDTFTFLRYNDVTYIPNVYKYMWQAQLRAGRFATY